MIVRFRVRPAIAAAIVGLRHVVISVVCPAFVLLVGRLSRLYIRCSMGCRQALHQ